MLELRDVSRSLGREPVLLGASLLISPDEPLAILGLQTVQHRDLVLKLLAGVDRPEAGTIRLDGRDMSRLRREKGRIVRVGPGGAKPTGQRVGKLVGREAAERVRLAGRLDAATNTLDLDQRMRLAIALARTGRPSLILLDAPGEGMSAELRERFIADLKSMLAGAGAVVVLAAATAEEARGLGGDVAIFDRGRLVQRGAVTEVFARPANLAAALASAHPALNTLALKVRDGSGILSDRSSFQPPEGLALPADGACTLAFHPEDTALQRAGASCVRFIVRAAGEETASGRRFARVTFAGASWLVPNPAAAPPAGMVLNVFVDRARLMVFDAEGKAMTCSRPSGPDRGALP